MRFFWLFCALGALLGCRSVSEPSGTAIALFCSTYQGAKTESLTVGEEVAVFACPEGTEDYFLEAAQFLVGSDGRSLSYGSTVYYPDPKQAVRFLAYFPFGGTWDKGRGTFSVPTDQSTAKALKEADLCGATASSTPVATPVALEFRHLMARLVITTKEPTTKITFPNAVASGVLHAATAELVLADTRSEVWTTDNELIVPVQPLSRLVLTVADTVLGVVSKVEYVFDGSVSLEAGRTTTLDLTLHPDTKTATLSGSSITDWELVKTEGTPSHAVSNVLTLHWPNYLLQGATPDRVVFTIGGTDYTVASGVTYANKTFTVPFASSALRYPYTITKIAFYRGATPALPSCADLLGSVIYKSGALTVGIKDFVYNSVLIDDLWWATGNLVASNAKAGGHGLGGCTVGEPADGGLYFQFGSLIGYKGGNQDNGGTGVGIPQAPLTTNGTYWNGATAYGWANDAMVWPTEMVGTKTSWTNTTGGNIATLTDYYFNYSVAPWETLFQNFRDFSVSISGDRGSGTLATGRYAPLGVGDPCTYYLGGTWRLSTNTELTSITSKTGSSWVAWSTVGLTGRWVTSSQIFSGISGPGAWFGPGLSAGSGTPNSNNNLFFPAAGIREKTNGSFSAVAFDGYYWSSSLYADLASCTIVVRLLDGVLLRGGSTRALGLSVRCVSSVHE